MKTKKLASMLALSTVLWSGVGASGCDDYRDLEKTKTAAMKYMNDASAAQEANKQKKWWSDYKNSKKKIVEYVSSIASTDSEAALWFIATGGIKGFSKRQATEDEASKMIGILRKVAQNLYGASSQSSKIYKDLNNVREEGLRHVKILYKAVDDLKKDKENLNIKVNSLQESNVKYKNQVNELTEKVDRNQKKIFQSMQEYMTDAETRITQRFEKEFSRLEEAGKKMTQSLEDQIKELRNEKTDLSSNLFQTLENTRKEFARISSEANLASAERYRQEKEERLAYQEKSDEERKEANKRAERDREERLAYQAKADQKEKEAKEKEDKAEIKAREKKEKYKIEVKAKEDKLQEKKVKYKEKEVNFQLLIAETKKISEEGRQREAELIKRIQRLEANNGHIRSKSMGHRSSRSSSYDSVNARIPHVGSATFVKSETILHSLASSDRN